MAHAPREKALAHFRRFADLMTRFRDDVEFVRTVARAACRASDPIKAAEGFVDTHDAVVTEWTSTGVESSIARSLAAIASLSAEPLSTGRKLLQTFEAVLALAKETHPQIARSIALSACRATEPLRTARVYLNNYDAIMRVRVQKTRRLPSSRALSQRPSPGPRSQRPVGRPSSRAAWYCAPCARRRMATTPSDTSRIEPFPGGRLIRHRIRGHAHLTIQISGDSLARALQAARRPRDAARSPSADLRRFPRHRHRVAAPTVTRPPRPRTSDPRRGAG